MDTTYGGVRQAVRHVCRRTGASAVAADHPCPIREPGEVLAAIDRAITPRTRLAVLDHIVSETGVVLPLREMVALVRERAPGVRVLVDGAHVPGQLALDIPSIGADWYAGNLHKWAFAPRSCGILWAAPEAQDGLHPTVVSWNLDQGFTAEFDWTGTRDPSVVPRRAGRARLPRAATVRRGARLQPRSAVARGGVARATVWRATREASRCRRARRNRCRDR